MKRFSLKLPEFLYIFSFLFYLLGSSITHFEQGVELSLWLMLFPILISSAVTTLPWLGIRWLQLNKSGCLVGWWLSLLIQIASWGTFVYAMFFRLSRNLPRFHSMITLTTLLWAAWLLIFIVSRHACTPRQPDDTLGA